MFTQNHFGGMANLQGLARSNNSEDTQVYVIKTVDFITIFSSFCQINN